MSMFPAKKITGKDKAALSAVKRCGFVAMETDGKPRLETSFELTPARLKRLVAHGLLAPSNDALLPDAPPQTYRLTEAGSAL
jgi:hypothetical protein